MLGPLGLTACPLGPLLLHFLFQWTFLHLLLRCLHCPTSQQWWPNCSWSFQVLSTPRVVNPSKQLPAAVKHHTKTVRPLLASRFHCLEGAKLQAAGAEFKQMEKDSIVHHSTSPWASPLHMVPKKDGSWQPCSHFRRRNQVTEPDLYPLPNITNFADQLSGCTVFSKIDLRKGY